uniref:Uncharacterized protein n=1 Tax=Setaria viridis TaxID=4556 RepID=A0A4U6VXP0_SETVI|nr:hypothetical protein SEVIR_2G252650v2 [Setaria viridis]
MTFLLLMIPKILPLLFQPNASFDSTTNLLPLREESFLFHQQTAYQLRMPSKFSN